MNAFWASENCDAFIVFWSFPSQENAPENSNQNWSSLKGSDQGRTIKNSASKSALLRAIPRNSLGSRPASDTNRNFHRSRAQ
ncbi:hypothetical protein B5K11_29080 [Rhizobium leguminosarum bv. trifolii]|nr:hypothetical protein B5K11_29080 [Rhizobium leguminosarum bv. trifolii]